MKKFLTLLFICLAVSGYNFNAGWDQGDITANRIQTVDSLPATCEQGSVVLLDTADSGQWIYACESQDTWVQQAGGSSGDSTNPTDGYIPVANNSAFIDSSIYDDGNVGIGTSSPEYTLDVAGDLRVNRPDGIGGIDSNTTLMLHMDGSDGGTTFTDSSPSPKTVTNYGSVTTESEQSVFGGTSVLLNTSTKYLSLADSNDWYPATGDFTIDFRVYINTLTGTQYIIRQHESIDRKQIIYISTNGSLIYAYQYGYPSAYAGSSDTGVFTTGQWYHVAIQRQSGVIKLYVDGTEQTFTTSWGNPASNFPNISASMNISYSGNTNNLYVDEFRWSSGIARYSGNFDPATQAYDTSSVSNQSVFTSLGNVGIGTTSPSEKLHVIGNGLFSGTITASNLSGTNTGDQDLSGYVPYTGATGSVDLGGNSLENIFQIGNVGYLNYGSAEIDMVSNTMIDYFGASSIDWANRILYNGDGVTQMVSWDTFDEVTINENGVDVDFRVESDTNTHALFVRGSDGNVGIGTDSPEELLHVNGNALFGTNVGAATSTPLNVSFGGTFGSNSPGNVGNLKWDMYNNAGGNRYGIGMSNSLMEFQAGASGGHGFFVNQGARAMTIAADKNVGIGISTPSVRLEIQSPTVAAGTPSTEEVFKLTRAVNSSVSYPQVASLALGTYETNSISNTYGPSTRLDFRMKSTSATNFDTDVTVMTLQDNGNIGIGTASPSEKLHISSTLGLSSGVFNKISDTGGQDAYFGVYRYGSGSRYGMISFAEPDGNNYAFLGNPSAGTFFNTPSGTSMYFRNNNTDKMVIDSSGNVGIGTDSPAGKLHSLATTEQLRLGYDASNYWSATVGSTGGLNLAGTGTGNDFSINTDDFYVDTSTGRVGIGGTTLGALLTIDGTGTFDITNGINIRNTVTNWSIFVPAAGELAIGGASSTFWRARYTPSGSTPANLFSIMNPSATAGITAAVRGISGQTGDLQQWQDSSATELASISATGGAYFADNVGIGTDSPDGPLHVLSGTTATLPTASADANDLVIENRDGQGGLTILTPNNSYGNIYFGDNEDNDVGRITYAHFGQSNSFEFRNNTSRTAVLGTAGLKVGAINTSGDPADAYLESWGTGDNLRLSYDNSNYVVLDVNSSGDLGITNGNVGIGTTAPTEMLDVSGGILSHAVTIDNGASSCIMLRDTDDAGWTECFALNGVLSCTIDADGQCDGS